MCETDSASQDRTLVIDFEIEIITNKCHQATLDLAALRHSVDFRVSRKLGVTRLLNLHGTEMMVD